MIKNIWILTFLLTVTPVLANLVQFQQNTPIKAIDLNNNFNHIKNILQSRNIPINFSSFNSNQLIENQVLESEFNKVRSLDIEITPLSLVQIKAAELNAAFVAMENGSNAADDIPTASSGSFHINEDSQYVGVLNYVNQIGISSVIITTPASNGTVLLGFNGSYTYIPNLNFNGSDSFSFKVNDGSNDSNIATIAISVSPVNDIPVANSQSLSTNEDVALSITLSGSDIESSPLTYEIVSAPSGGVLSGGGANQIYTPNADFNGSDSFTFRVFDGTDYSTNKIVSISIAAINDIPVANTQSLSTNEDVALNITLTGSDVEGATLVYAISATPTNGVLSGTGANRIYTPNSNYNGSDSFTFTVSDGVNSPVSATISLVVNSVNDIPVMNPLSFSTTVDLAYSGSLTSSDIENQTRTYSVVTNPSKGAVSLNSSSGAFTYTPNASQFGTDSFVVRAFDGQDFSTNSTVSITFTNTRSCSANGGTGSQTFNTTTSVWGNCLLTACSTGIPSTDQLECVLINATGGSVQIAGDYKIHTFNSNASFSVISGQTTGFEILVVAGGGGGGSSKSSLGGGGGGGAGGLIYNTSQTLAIQSYAVTIGSGGNPGTANVGTVGQNGQNSSFGSLLTATGGGGGAHGLGSSAGVAGGSGGGAGYNSYSAGGVRSGGTGVSGQGFAGGASSRVTTNSAAGAGGGGSNGVGDINQLNHTGGTGGPGRMINITGISTEYARGGHGGGGHTVLNGTANTGNGGYACYAAGNAGAGGSGIVIVKYKYK